MIQQYTVLNVADNSGAKKLRVVGVPGSSRRRFAFVGDLVKVAVRGAASTGTVADHSMHTALLVRSRKEVRRKDGSYIRFDDNAAVLLDKDGNMVGTRVFGPIAREIREAGYLKIVSLAEEVW